MNDPTILSRRAYPGYKKSGICSRHRDGGHFDCLICYPNPNELLKSHMEVYNNLYEEILKLSGLSDPPNGRIGTNAIVAELRRKLSMKLEWNAPKYTMKQLVYLLIGSIIAAAILTLLDKYL